MRKRRENRLNAWLADEAQKSIQPKPETLAEQREHAWKTKWSKEGPFCSICRVEFEPETPFVRRGHPSNYGYYHEGCWNKLQREKGWLIVNSDGSSETWSPPSGTGNGG